MTSMPLKISLFYCLNCISSADINYLSSRLEDVELNAIGVPCSGKVNIQYLMKSIETGTDQAILIGCGMGDCRYLQGSIRAQKRIDAINEILSEMGLGGECVRFISRDNIDRQHKIVYEVKTAIGR
jgi:F420-non-reducing hydrogenase iron-sulfur subunit